MAGFKIPPFYSQDAKMNLTGYSNEKKDYLTLHPLNPHKSIVSFKVSNDEFDGYRTKRGTIFRHGQGTGTEGWTQMTGDFSDPEWNQLFPNLLADAGLCMDRTRKPKFMKNALGKPRPVVGVYESNHYPIAVPITATAALILKHGHNGPQLTPNEVADKYGF